MMKIQLLILGALVLATTSFVQAQPTVATPKFRPPSQTQAQFETLMNALEDDDYALFLSPGDDAFKAALTKDVFASVVAQLAPRQKTGYSAKYLDELKQKGFVVHVWKIEFNDGGDDFLAQMSVKDGKVGGFFLR